MTSTSPKQPPAGMTAKLSAETKAAEAAAAAAEFPLTAALESQNGESGEPIQPGEPGWWQVWGAGPRDIEVGDLIAIKWTDTGYHEFAITEVPAQEGIADQCAPRFVTATGETIRVGMLKKIVLLRRGTHNTLSPYCR